MAAVTPADSHNAFLQGLQQSVVSRAAAGSNAVAYVFGMWFVSAVVTILVIYALRSGKTALLCGALAFEGIRMLPLPLWAAFGFIVGFQESTRQYSAFLRKRKTEVVAHGSDASTSKNDGQA